MTKTLFFDLFKTVGKPSGATIELHLWCRPLGLPLGADLLPTLLVFGPLGGASYADEGPDGRPREPQAGHQGPRRAPRYVGFCSRWLWFGMHVTVHTPSLPVFAFVRGVKLP